MRVTLLSIIWIVVFNMPLTAVAATQKQTDVDALHIELQQLRQEYETRLSELEKRVAAAEQQAETPPAVPVVPAGAMAMPAAASMESVGINSTLFNPAMGVIFQGHVWGYRRDPKQFKIAGFPLGGEAGPVSEGLGVGETEIDLSANVDDKFTAWLTLPVTVKNSGASIDIEEAWIETTAMPAGFAARFGRMFSGIGYLNSRHSHTWDFIDQPLPYQAFLGDQYLDDGLQIRWLAPTDLYLELGAEIMRGSNYPADGATESGFGTRSVYAHAGGDVGASSSWLAGLSYLHAGSAARASGDADSLLFFTGNTDLVIADFIWKWAPQGNWRQKNFKLQSEFLWRQERGDYRLPPATGVRLPYDNDQYGWYIQAIYQPFQRWRFGARYDMLSADNPGPLFAGTDLQPLGRDPKRFSIMTDWSNSEFSRLRFQYTHDESGLLKNDQWGLQYIYSIGAHGAHTF